MIGQRTIITMILSLSDYIHNDDSVCLHVVQISCDVNITCTIEDVKFADWSVELMVKIIHK